MAKLVNCVITQKIAGSMVTKFNDGSFAKKLLVTGDIIEGLRWTENEEVHSATGKISSIIYYADRVSKNSIKEPIDYFSKDVSLYNIKVDTSEEYQSKIVSINSREIVEFEGVENVQSVFVKPVAIIELDMEYTDGEIIHQSLEIGDILENITIMTTPGNPDIVGNFKIAAWDYTVSKGIIKINGMYLVPIDESYNSNILVKFDKILGFSEIPTVEISNPSSLASIATALTETDQIAVSLGVDVTIPRRDDGRITTVMINEGKTVDLDLNGHSITTEAYAFYVNGGTLNITDESGNGGKIVCTRPNSAYPAVMVLTGGECNMYSGEIDTTQVDTSGSNVNWLYGVVCSGDGVFNMYGGKIITDTASTISITNGTASGSGSQFTIGEDSVLETLGCAAIYLADNKSVVIKDNAVVKGGIVARMGDITVQDNAKVYGPSDESKIAPLGEQVMLSGVDCCAAGIIGLTGVYNSSLGNDMNITIKDNAKVMSYFGKAVEIAEINTKYDQVVNVNVDRKDNLKSSYRIYPHDELAELVAETGKVLAPETNTTTLTITINDEQVFPVVDEGGEDNE